MVVGTTKRRRVAIGPRPTSRAKNVCSSESSPVIAEGDEHPVGKNKEPICRCSSVVEGLLYALVKRVGSAFGEGAQVVAALHAYLSVSHQTNA